MDIVINTTGIDKFLSLPPEMMFWSFLGNFGWVAIGAAFVIGVLQVYLKYMRMQWSKSHKDILLAIDIPKGNEQSPKAVENMFTYLAGAHGSVNFFEKWFQGIYQKSFSYEIVSSEGYTQFLIRTPLEFRNLIESSVYSQYPDAEISEVDDYTESFPHSWPDEEYDIWGTEFIQHTSKVYPIKLYKEFEHQMGPSETQFKDPMASLMDLCGSLRQGEHLWYQIVITPVGFEWIKESEEEINKILGKKKKPKNDLFLKLLEMLGELSEVFYSIWGDVEKKPEKEVKSKSMMELTPDEKRKVEGIQEKAGKLAFEAKIRTVYIAKKEVMNKNKVANGVIGYMKQFIALDLNNLKPDVKKTMTRAVYFLKESTLLEKKRRIFSAYIERSDWRGRLPGLFNIEELATIWHFPVEANVKSPMIQKAPGRKADAPSSLPLATELTDITPNFFKNDIINTMQTSKQVTDSLVSIDPEKDSLANFVTPDILSTIPEDLLQKKSTPPPNLPTI